MGAPTRKEIVFKLATNSRVVERALVVLRDAGAFSTTDKKFGTELADQISSGKSLSDRQLRFGRLIALRYVGLLVEKAKEKASKSPKSS